MLIAFDCKRHTKPVKLKDVAAFADQVEDVGAHLGVMVSSSGFDDGARATAKKHGITLQTYREAQNTDWESVVGRNASMFITRVDLAELSATVTLDDKDCTSMDISPDTSLFDKNSLSAHNIVSYFWNYLRSPDFPKLIGDINVDFIPVECMSIITKHGHQKIRKLTIRAKMIGKLYPISLEFDGGHLLENDGSPSSFYTELNSLGVDWRATMESSPGIDLTPEEYAEYMKSSRASLDLDKVERYIRVTLTTKRTIDS